MECIALPSLSLLTESRFGELYRKFNTAPASHVFAGRPQDSVSAVGELLQHAFENVPFYRDRMQACGLDPKSFRSLDELGALPPTTKADIAANFPDGITDASQQFKPWRYRSTSGTIERLTVIHDYRKRDVVRATEIFALRSATRYRPGMKYLEIPPDVCRNVCGAAGMVEPPIARFFVDNLVARKLSDPDVVSDLRGMAERQLLYRRLTLPSDARHGAVLPPETLNGYLQSIREYRPFVVKALPIYLYMLAGHIASSGLRPPKIRGGLMPMGSSMPPLMKRAVETAFSAPVHEDYGSAELGAIGAECGRQNGIHSFTRLFHVEVMRDGRPARPGEIGKVLITDLRNFAMPFIRYEIGDVALVLNGSCACGLEGLRLDVQGRHQDCIRAADGSIVTSDAIFDAVQSCPGVRIFRLELHEGRRALLEVVPVPGAAPDLAAIESALVDLLGEPLQFSARQVPTIMPEPGGKYRFVKNCAAEAGKLL
jgi:phenylacetate-CoA ligase